MPPDRSARRRRRPTGPFALLLCVALASCGEGPATVQQARLSSIDIPVAEVSFDAIAETATLQVVARDDSGQTMTGVAIGWSSRDGAVATVDGGRVTAAGNGETWVVAAAGGLQDSTRVTVQQVPVAFAVTPSEDSIWTLGGSASFSATPVDANGFATPDGGPDTWDTSDPSVATVDASGTATGLQDGTVTVTASLSGVSGDATLVVDERGAVAVQFVHVGGGVDPDGYTLGLGARSAAVASDGETVVADIPAGPHVVDLTGIAHHCVWRDDGQPATVTKGDTTQLQLEVRCSGRFAYESWADGVYRLAYADEAGQATILSPEDIERGSFSWSPDGSWIAFSKLVGGNTDVYVIRPDGTGEHRLTTHPGADVSPTWSPDGTRIAYRSQADTAEAIWVVDRDGTNGVEVRTLPTSLLLTGPVWSPTEDLIAFVSPEPGLQAQVWTMGSDGSNAQVIGPFAWSLTPVWSPDGERIAVAVAGSSQWELLVMDKTGVNGIVVATSGQSALRPAWSPDGGRIAFSKHDGSRYGVYVVDAVGGNEVYLTTAQGTGQDPAFAADGSHVLFMGVPTNLSAVMAVDADGGSMTVVSPEGGGDPLPRPGS